MARRRNGGAGGNGGIDGGGYGDDPQRPGRQHGGDPVAIHEAYVLRHLEGGAPASSEAYERARAQFRRLPGAVRVPATEVTPPPVEPTPYDSDTETVDDATEE